MASQSYSPISPSWSDENESYDDISGNGRAKASIDPSKLVRYEVDGSTNTFRQFIDDNQLLYLPLLAIEAFCNSDDYFVGACIPPCDEVLVFFFLFFSFAYNKPKNPCFDRPGRD